MNGTYTEKSLYPTGQHTQATENNTNKLGLLAADSAVIDLFNEAPEKMKRYFIETLRYENATRSNTDSYAPSLNDWLNCFDEYGWINESRKTKLILPEN